MKRAFLFTAVMIGLLPLACIKPCPEEPASQTIPENIELGYRGTESRTAPIRQDTFAFVMDTNFQMHAYISGTTKYLVNTEQLWFDAGNLYATKKCPGSAWAGFDPGIDSITIKADRNIGVIPAGESLNSVFLCRYPTSSWYYNAWVTLASYNDSLQTTSYLTNYNDQDMGY